MFFIIGMFFIQATKYIYRHRTRDSFIFVNKMFNHFFYIEDKHHISCGIQQQYDYLLYITNYGWETMIDWAEYMSRIDIPEIETITTGGIFETEEIEIIKSYKNHGNNIKHIPEFTEEKEALSIGGYSNTLGVNVKIVWFNQTRMVRIFTVIND